MVAPCTCGRVLLPYDRILPAEGSAPALWRWLCPVECTTRQEIGDPLRELVVTSLAHWPRAGTTTVTVVSRPHDVYVGRAGHGHDGYFGNPIVPGRPCLVCNRRHGRDASLLTCYGRHLRRRMATEPGFRERLYALRGLRLACFCRYRGDEPCHAAIMAAVIDASCRPRPAIEAFIDKTGAGRRAPGRDTIGPELYG